MTLNLKKSANNYRNRGGSFLLAHHIGPSYRCRLCRVEALDEVEVKVLVEVKVGALDEVEIRVLLRSCL